MHQALAWLPCGDPGRSGSKTNRGKFPEKANSHKPQPTDIWWIVSLLWGDVAGALLTPCSHCHHKETALTNTLLSFPLPLPAAAGRLGNLGECRGRREGGNCKGPFPGFSRLALNITSRTGVHHRQLWPSQIKAALIYQDVIDI